MKKSFSVIALTILFTLSLFAQKSKEPDYASFISKYRKNFAERLEKNKVGGFSIAVVDGDKVIWTEGFGNYDAKNPQKINENTAFLTGNNSALFTALAVMQLQEKKLIDIDQPYKKYVPDFVLKQINGQEQNVTIRQIITHHGGIPDIMINKYRTKSMSLDTLLYYVNRDYATFPPNTIYSYSETGYGLLGILIQRVSHQSYEDYITQNILKPLGMNNSGIFTPDSDIASLWVGYDKNDSEKREIPNLNEASGGLYSTAADMAQYIRLILNQQKDKNKIIKTKSLNELTCVQNSDVYNDLGLPIGMDWDIYYHVAGKCITHAGVTNWQKSRICIAMEAGFGIVMFTNLLEGSELIRYCCLNMVDDLKKLKDCDTTTFSHASRFVSNHQFNYKKNPTFAPDTLTLEKKLEICGNYGTFGACNAITLRDNNLFVYYHGSPLYLLPVQNGEFVASPTSGYENANPKNRFYFEKINDRLNVVLIGEYGDRANYGEKIELFTLNPAWEKRLGNYELIPDENGSPKMENFQMVYQDSIIVLKAKYTKDFGYPDPVIPLRIINNSLAVIPGYGYLAGHSVQIIQDKANKREILRFMGQDMYLKQ